MPADIYDKFFIYFYIIPMGEMSAGIRSYSALKRTITCGQSFGESFLTDCKVSPQTIVDNKHGPWPLGSMNGVLSPKQK
jgi:hypothetical protein